MNTNTEPLSIIETPVLVVSDYLTLRPTDIDDTERFMRLVAENQTHLKKWFRDPASPSTADDRRKMMAADLEAVERGGRHWWMIELNDELVGTIDIHQISKYPRAGLVGYWLGEKFTGKGIMTDSLRAVLNWAFTEHNFLRIEIQMAIENRASSAVPERLGIRREAIFRQSNIINGAIQDMAGYAVFADNWPPKPPEPALPAREVRVDDEILLRQDIETDRDDMWKALGAGRDYVSKYLPWMSAYNVEDDHARGYNTRRNERDNFDGSGHYIIEYKGEFAGTVGFGSHNRNNGAEIGYWLRQDLQGRGIMTRSVEAVITMLIVDVGIHRVTIRAATSNLPSRGIPERLGFHYEGTMRGASYVNNEYMDLEIYSMIDHEWRARSKNA
jgi:ribosomal-protein-serine acetyltransferase